MKKAILIVASIVSFTLSSQAQIVSIKDSEVEVRDEQGHYITSKRFSNLVDACGGNGIVAVWLEDGMVEVRDEKLKYITSKRFSDVRSVKISGRNVVIQFTDGKMEVRDANLKYISSR